MNLRERILTENLCYKAGRRITPAGIVVHSTGANNPNLRRYVQPDDGELGINTAGNDWNRESFNGKRLTKCVHAFIGKLSDGTIATYQTLPWDMRCWGCASGSKGSFNNSHIQFEICEDALSDAGYFLLVYREAVELCAYLCGMFSLSPESVVCHSEAHDLGYASAHADVMHWFPRFGKTMDEFRKDVREELEMDYEKFKEYMTRFLAELAKAEPSAWSAEEREWAESTGLIVGDAEGNKQYKAYCTREQMVTFMYRLKGLPGE